MTDHHSTLLRPYLVDRIPGPRPRSAWRFRTLLAALVPLLAGACIIDDGDVGSGGTGDIGEVLDASLDDDMAALATSCSYNNIWFANQEPYIDPSLAEDLYDITPGCRAALEKLLQKRITFSNFGAPGGQEAMDRLVEGIHAYLFLPAFLPPVDPALGVPAVYRGDGASFPFPEMMATLLPPVPVGYDYELSPEDYNGPQAELFFQLVQGFEFNPGSNSEGSAVAEWQGGVIVLYGSFAPTVVDSLHAAETLHHEMAHAWTAFHIPCAVSWQASPMGGGSCLVGPGDSGDCDCGYASSAYWEGLAYRQAALLGGLISRHPATDEPIIHGSLDNVLSEELCEQAVMQIRQVEAEVVAAPGFTCENANDFLIAELQAYSPYWYVGFCGDGLCSEDEDAFWDCPKDCD